MGDLIQLTSIGEQEYAKAWLLSHEILMALPTTEFIPARVHAMLTTSFVLWDIFEKQLREQNLWGEVEENIKELILKLNNAFPHISDAAFQQAAKKILKERIDT